MRYRQQQLVKRMDDTKSGRLAALRLSLSYLPSLTRAVALYTSSSKDILDLYKTCSYARVAMLKLKLKYILLLGVLFLIYPHTISAAVTWNETQPAGNTNIFWHTLSISSDGTTLLTGAENGRLYRSTNGGSSWTETQPAGNTTAYWYASAISSNGQKMIVGASSGRLYLSSDYGANWTETQPDGNSTRRWSTASMSSDGQTILVTEDSGLSTNGRAFISTNGGSAWTETQPAGNADRRWIAAGISSDGTKMVLTTWQGYGRIFISSNSGGSWTEAQPAGNTDKNWYAAAVSADGQKIVVGYSTGRIYLSTNGGSTWAETQPAGDTNIAWQTAAISSDGQTIIAAAYSGRMYLTTDGGTNWAETQPAGNTNRPWIYTVMSADATVLAGNVFNGRVYVASNPLPSPTPVPTRYEAPAPPVETPKCTVAKPSTPELFQISTTGTTAKLYYTPKLGPGNKIAIAYGYKPGENRFGIEFPSSNTLGIQTYSINYLTPNTTYYFRLRAGNDCMPGEWGTELKATTNNSKQVTKTQVLGTINSTTCGDYSVQPGDSLWSIARNNLGSGSKYHYLLEQNKLSSDKIRVGQKLNLGC